MISEKNLKVIENFIQIFDSNIYRKKEILMDIDQVHRDLFYIKKGVARIFYYDDKAQDHTHWISSDHSFIALFSSVLSGKAAQHFEMESIGPKITQDFLLLGSNEDHFIPVELCKRVIDALPNVKSLTYKMYTKYDHAENHCNFGNTELVLSDIVHWMLHARNK